MMDGEETKRERESAKKGNSESKTSSVTRLGDFSSFGPFVKVSQIGTFPVAKV